MGRMGKGFNDISMRSLNFQDRIYIIVLNSLYTDVFFNVKI